MSSSRPLRKPRMKATGKMKIDGAAATDTTTTTTTTTGGDYSHRICDDVLEVIGNTPLVRLNRIGKTGGSSSSSVGGCDLVVKCEFFNAGGSVKDRIAKQMVNEAESQGLISPGDTLIEPTSGNTGIGLALASAVKGYKAIITLPEKMSNEKVDVLKSLNAEIIRTPTEAAYDAPDSHISVARRLCDELPNSHILDQYSNQANPDAHYYGTGREIWNQTGGKVDMLVCGAGTGGTISGTARALKEKNPDIIIVGIDPEGSILAVPDQLNDKKRLEAYHVEGIGYDFIPGVLDRSLVDVWYKSNDKESLLMMRRLIREEGLLCGGSSGAAVACALRAVKDYKLGPGKRCAIILPDSVRNYMTKALSDDWMADHGFMDDEGMIVKAKNYEQWWSSKRLWELKLNTPLTISSDVLCKDAIALLKREGFDMVPVLEDGHVVGVVTEGNMITRILSGRCSPDSTVAEAGVIYKTFHKFSMNDTLADLAKALDHDPFALIVTEQRCFTGGRKRKIIDAESLSIDPRAAGAPSASSSMASIGSKGGDDLSGMICGGGGGAVSSSSASQQVTTRSVVSGIVSRIDLLDFISHGDPNAAAKASAATASN